MSQPTQDLKTSNHQAKASQPRQSREGDCSGYVPLWAQLEAEERMRASA